MLLKKNRFLLVLMTFMLLYNPPIGRIKSLLVLFAISAIYFLMNYKTVERFFYKIIFAYLIWFSLFVYIFIVARFNNNPPSYLQSFVYILASVIPASFMITSITKRRHHDFSYYLDTILYAGSIQSILSIMAFFVGSIKNIFVQLMIRGGVFQDNTYSDYMQSVRLFGFSTGLTFGMPAVQAFLAIVALFMAINCKKHCLKYYIMVPLLAFSGVINARTTIVIMGIGIVALLFSFPRGSFSQKAIRIFRILGLVLLAFIVLYFALNIIKSLSPTTFVWFEEGLSQITRFFYGDTSSGYFSYIADNSKWDLPSGLNLLFGMGIRVMNPNDTGIFTDIGYVNDIAFGGIIYAAILYMVMLKYIFSIKKYRDFVYPSINRFLCIFFLGSFIVLNFKGYVFDLNNFFALFIMIVVFCSKLKKETIELKTRKMRINLG